MSRNDTLYDKKVAKKAKKERCTAVRARAKGSKNRREKREAHSFGVLPGSPTLTDAGCWARPVGIMMDGGLTGVDMAFAAVDVMLAPNTALRDDGMPI